MSWRVNTASVRVSISRITSGRARIRCAFSRRASACSSTRSASTPRRSIPTACTPTCLVGLSSISARRVAPRIGPELQPVPLRHLVQPLRQQRPQRVDRVVPHRQATLPLVGVRQLQRRLPAESFRADLPRGHHQMGVVIAPVALLVRQVDRPIHRHPVARGDCPRPCHHQLLPLPGRHLRRQRHLDLARDPPVLPLLRRFRRVPQLLARPARPPVLRRLQSGRHHSVPPRIVVQLLRALVEQLFARPVRRRGHRALPRPAADMPARVHPKLRPGTHRQR